MKPKFKVGDRVVVIDPFASSAKPVLKSNRSVLGTISDTRGPEDGLYYTVALDGDETYCNGFNPVAWAYYPSNLRHTVNEQVFLAREALRKLTRSNRRKPELIAKYLEKRGIKGHIGTRGGQCPIGNYLGSEGIVSKIAVGIDCIFVDNECIPLHSNLTEFIRDFDFYRYPQLVQK